MRKGFLTIIFLLPILLSAQDFYAWDTVREIRITFPFSNWQQQLNVLKDRGKKERLDARLEIDGVTYDGVGVRFKGNSSFKSVRRDGAGKLPFNIKVDHTHNKQCLPGGFETLKLSNGFRDPTFLREILSYEVARKYVPAPECNFARLYINDEYIGLYNNVESVNKDFIKKAFDEKDGALIKCDPEWGARVFPDCPQGDKASLMYLGNDIKCYIGSYELKSDEGWEELIELTRVLNKDPEKLEAYLDVDQTLWMHAFNNVMVNLDSYTGRLCHNYYLYRDKSGLFIPLLWDMNLSLGGFRYDGGGLPLTNEELISLSPFVHFKSRNKKRPLLVHLLENALWRKVYVAHMRTILEENFWNGAFFRRGEEIREFIRKEVEADPHRLYGLDDFEQNWESTVNLDGQEIIGIRELMDARIEYLKAHPLFQQPPPEIGAVEHFQLDDLLGIQARVEGATQVYLVYRLDEKLTWQRIELYDDSGHLDVEKGDGIWGGSIQFHPGTRYYIIAENDRAAALSPSNASRHAYRVSEEKKQ